MLINFLSFSQVRAVESFNYPPTTLAGIGTAGNGFAGPWVNDETGGIEGLVTIGNTRFDYASLNYEIPHDTIHLQAVKSGVWSDHNRYKRPLAQVWPNTAGNKYWISYLVDVKEPLPVGNTYFMVKLYYGSGELLAIGKGGGRDTNPPVWTCGSGWPGQSGDDVSTVEILPGPVWVVVMINMSGGTGVDRTYMWIDPDPNGAEPDTNTAIVKRTSNMPSGFDNIAVEFGGDGANVRLIFDEITVASSFANLTAVWREGNNIPFKYSLSQNYPNPFNPVTKIRFDIPESGIINIKVYNLIGQEVAEVLNEYKNAGTYTVDFNAINLSSGVYFYKITSDKYTETRKMVLMK